MEITTIIFDLGNVVLTNDWHYDCPEKDKEFSDYFGITDDDMERGWKAAWPDYKKGRITEDVFWNKFLKIAGAKKLDIDKAKEIYRKYQRPIEEMPDLLRRLKQRYKIGALTNISKEWLEFKLAQFQLKDVFNGIVSSGHSGIDKPNIEIYHLILKRLNVSPQECIFIDDKESCLVPARELGITTIRFISQKLLEKNLRKLNIEF